MKLSLTVLLGTVVLTHASYVSLPFLPSRTQALPQESATRGFFSGWFHGRCKCPRAVAGQEVCCLTKSGYQSVASACECACEKGVPVQKPTSQCGLPHKCKFCLPLPLPVCCRTAAGYLNVRNPCSCGCRDGEVVKFGTCPRSCRCPRRLAPVCCSVRGSKVTKVNSCACGCAKGSVIYDGACNRSAPKPAPKPVVEPKPEGPKPCPCPAIYAPVCCDKAGSSETVSNSCVCECDGGTVLSDGSCPAVEPKPEEPKPCVCPRIYAPVCCSSADGPKTEPNACECKCDGGTVLSEGSCPAVEPKPEVPKPCACPAIYAPVCCSSADGPKTEPNACECECDGGTVLSEGSCPAVEPKPEGPKPAVPKPCVCPAIYAPVCCDKAGSSETASNSCMCECNGGTVLSDGSCPAVEPKPEEPKPCVCPDIYAPVCCLGKDSLETVSNSCMCKCDGGTVMLDGPCY